MFLATIVTLTIAVLSYWYFCYSEQPSKPAYLSAVVFITSWTIGFRWEHLWQTPIEWVFIVIATVLSAVGAFWGARQREAH